MNFQDLLQALSGFWARRGCVLQMPYDLEVGAGTMNPDTFFRALGPEPWRVGYCEPSRRPVDGRYGDNPYRLYKHYQYQVLLKPSPPDIQEIYLESLASFGVVSSDHEIRFEEDNWESPTLGAAGVGWQVLLDGMEITQFTYFQQVGGIKLKRIPVEITYGVERIAMYLTGIDNVFDLPWNDHVSYGMVRRQDEYEQSSYAFDAADLDLLHELFDRHEAEAARTLEKGLVIPAYEHALRCSHVFNLLDARGGVSVTERPAYIARVRRLACVAAENWIEQRARAEYPLLPRDQARHLLAAEQAARETGATGKQGRKGKKRGAGGGRTA